ncbi:hypothetical protein CCR95_19050 [Thiocystis minor]|uniref:hypothetical protein n=1 Tax=Thiocystis minor TaxID=61597 RepID=UPI00191211B1|nr:hypothetical protein [Thiocystis minor]MBK5966120.1 hypothetical protein [Thiocystis minor]
MTQRLTLVLLTMLTATQAPAQSTYLAATCTDVCLYGATSNGANCTLWDAAVGDWVRNPTDGPGELHNRARHYATVLHRWMLPAGGVMSTRFTDASLTEVADYGGRRDSAIWTGAYLASEALRFLSTGAPDAARSIDETVATLHRWWRIPGDPGYLARYAAPADSPAPVQAILSADDPEVHREVPFEDALWHWRGNISRDQYQGVLLGYSLAYQATSNPEVRETIRQDVVEFVEQLMSGERRPVRISVNGRATTREVSIPYAVFSTADAPDGIPSLTFQTDPFSAAGEGVLFFAPNATDLLNQIFGFSPFPSLPQPTQAIQLAAIFRVALQVTDDVPAYASRRQAIAEHYERKVGAWLEIATGWRNTNRCDEGYFGLNIGFMPLFNWVRLETDPVRQERLRQEVLRDALWAEVAEHKNVFFALIYGSQAPLEDDVPAVLDEHVAQLALFPTAPNWALPRDLRGIYPESTQCPGISAVAVNVDERVPATFVWERNPWKLYDPGTPNQMYPGIDYLLAYWMGRFYGFIEDDATGTCLWWSEAGT